MTSLEIVHECSPQRSAIQLLMRRSILFVQRFADRENNILLSVGDERS